MQDNVPTSGSHLSKLSVSIEVMSQIRISSAFVQNADQQFRVQAVSSPRKTHTNVLESEGTLKVNSSVISCIVIM